MNIFQYKTNAWDLEKYSSKRLPLYGDDRAMPTESGVKARPRCKKLSAKRLPWPIAWFSAGWPA